MVGRAQPRNDVAIVTISPMLDNQVNFQNIQAVLEFFEHKRVAVDSIQPGSFGQAYVRFSAIFDRDNLINDFPNNFGNLDHLSQTK
uniref:DUF7597 domain-containing protein n=1 Tax=Arundo donax TaxID=35708 RepID=A0A0A9BIY9_ARUDO